MAELVDSFARLLGRQPSDAERLRLYSVRDALGLQTNDALWIVLLALQHHQTLYEGIPTAIAETAKATLADIRKTADAAMLSSAEATKAELTKAVASTAAEVAYRAARNQPWQWATAYLVAFLTIACAAGAAFVYGRERGHAETFDEQAAASWANTPAGKIAYQLAQAGTLEDLAHCRGEGWKAKDGFCYAYPVNGHVSGWHVVPDNRSSFLPHARTR